MCVVIKIRFITFYFLTLYLLMLLASLCMCMCKRWFGVCTPNHRFRICQLDLSANFNHVQSLTTLKSFYDYSLLDRLELCYHINTFSCFVQLVRAPATHFSLLLIFFLSHLSRFFHLPEPFLPSFYLKRVANCHWRWLPVSIRYKKTYHRKKFLFW